MKSSKFEIIYIRTVRVLRRLRGRFIVRNRPDLLISDANGIDNVLHSANNRERSELSRFGIFARYVFDVDVKPPELAFNLDVMIIALESGHSKNTNLCFVGAYTCQAYRR